jgi:cytochrome c oxidase cbb3-type subunit 4
MTYEFVSRFAQQAGTVYFVLIFLAGAAYGLWPRNKETFRQASRTPLEDGEDL